eukprot:gnl/TRDRNA2_/TRDRNA2_160009_c0_seq1.p1 gnl/TRDRNA2_/TRDRNA2_160009_c0~~gnl/TRDRNA2_/TRDRNA2_160009_c0_seq1.p1  ORF type:complete len:328 (+),score=72.26 gnl/TRDRNA2_/TRDRNA2_160009_c0_seq1:75-1058(+)
MFDFDEVPDDMGGPSASCLSAMSKAEEMSRGESWKSYRESQESLPACLGGEVAEEEMEFWRLDEESLGESEGCLKELLDADGNMPKLSEELIPTLAVGVARLKSSVQTPATKMPVGVVFVCGMPEQEFGNARMNDPLPTLILQKCWSLGLPTVRFDYSGYGKSEKSVEAGKVPMQVQAGRVLRRVMAELFEKVAMVCFSAGNFHSIDEVAMVHKMHRLAAYVNLSHGTRAVAFSIADAELSLKILMDKEAVLNPGMRLEVYDGLDVPTLVIVGQNDRLTRKVDMEKIFCRKQRKEFPGKHAFENGCEEAPAEAIKQFLHKALTWKAP